MKLFAKSVLLLALMPMMAFAPVHKFYVSVTRVDYSEKDDALQITTRIFIDDLEAVLLERYGTETNLATDRETDSADSLIAKYLHARFTLRVNGEERPVVFLGKKYDNDVAVCFMEVSNLNLPSVTSLEVQNDLLTDLFEEQQNVVHFKIRDTKKSFVLVRENNKGMLNW
jgi:hypothetical protein